MSWNGPGNDDQKDPWKGGKGQEPPNLDEVFKKIYQRFQRAFNNQDSNNSNDAPSFAGLGFFLIIILGLYLISGFYIVRPAERAAVFMFGKYQDTVGPGPHWIARFIQSKTVVNVDQVASSSHSAHMLTSDENIVSVEIGVQYRIKSISDYLFNVFQPEKTLEQVTDSAVRQIIGHSTLDEILTKGRENIRKMIRAEIIRALDNYKSGLEILDVPMQPARAPEAVKAAFDDAIKAQEDEVRSINRAKAYMEKKIPLAEGMAQRKIEEAEGYKAETVLMAQGDTERFLRILPEYKKAPKVTKQRLYLDTMEKVLGNTSKILIDQDKSNSLFYLPLDKILSEQTKFKEDNENESYNDEIIVPNLQTIKARELARTSSKNQANNNPRSRDNYSR